MAKLIGVLPPLAQVAGLGLVALGVALALGVAAGVAAAGVALFAVGLVLDLPRRR